MPAGKKQKTGNDTSAPTQEGSSTSSTPHKNDKKGRDADSIPPHEYVCIHRPHFDLEAEARTRDEQLEEDELHDEYVKIFEEEKATGKIFQPAAQNKEWKWVMMWEGWKIFCDYKRRAKYCDPDLFGMYIYNDFHGWGLQELMENMIISFDAGLKKKDENSCFQMWAVISALGLWLNEEEMGAFINNEDGEKVKALTGLMGSALLRALAAIEDGGELKPDSKFLDLPIVISSFLEWARDLEDYGIDDDAVAWRPHTVAYYEKAGLDPEKGIAGTAKLLETLKDENEEEGNATEVSEKDPWGWSKRLKAYKKDYGTPKIGGTKYDITKFSRKERAKYAFDKKDPLKDISDKDLKEGNLDLA